MIKSKVKILLLNILLKDQPKKRINKFNLCKINNNTFKMN